jgi:hypothetical protein
MSTRAALAQRGQSRRRPCVSDALWSGRSAWKDSQMGPATSKRANMQRNVAAAQAAGIVVARIAVNTEGRIVIVATPSGGIPAEIGKFGEAVE